MVVLVSKPQFDIPESLISVARHAHRDGSYAFSGPRPLPYFFIGSRNQARVSTAPWRALS